MLAKERRSLKVVAFLRERPVETATAIKEAIQITQNQMSNTMLELCSLKIVRATRKGYRLNDGLTDDCVMALLNISDWNEGNEVLRLPVEELPEDNPDFWQDDKIEILNMGNRVTHVLSSWSARSHRQAEQSVNNALSGATPNSVFERK